MEEKLANEFEKPFPKNRKYFYKVMQHLKISSETARFQPALVKIAKRAEAETPDVIEVHGPPLPIKKRRLNAVFRENEERETVITDNSTVVVTEDAVEKTVPKP